MILGHRAGVGVREALDSYLATIADHGFNASTFTPGSWPPSIRLISSLAGGALRAQGPRGMASRRARSSTCWTDRRVLARRGLCSTTPRARAHPDGLRSSHLQVRDPRATSSHRGPRASRPPPLAYATAVERRHRPLRKPSRPQSRHQVRVITPRCSWRRSRCRGSSSPPCSRRPHGRLVRATSSSRIMSAASSAHSLTMSGRDLNNAARRHAPPSGARTARVPRV